MCDNIEKSSQKASTIFFLPVFTRCIPFPCSLNLNATLECKNESHRLEKADQKGVRAFENKAEQSRQTTFRLRSSKLLCDRKIALNSAANQCYFVLPAHALKINFSTQILLLSKQTHALPLTLLPFYSLKLYIASLSFNNQFLDISLLIRKSLMKGNGFFD